jgi:hypothetical protein
MGVSVGGAGVGVSVGVAVGVSVGVGVGVSVGVGVTVGVGVGVTVGNSTVATGIGVRGMNCAGGRITRAIIRTAQRKTKTLRPRKTIVTVL